MERNLGRLSTEQFDVLVIGGGIYGAFAAWDAASRGMSVGLVEKSDFMSGTSSNSMKVLHGGLRYLPDLRPDRVRRMVRERSAMMRLAPHLVRPLPFVLPSHGRGMRSRAALGFGLRLNDVLSLDRNRGLPHELHLPPGRMLSPAEFAAAFPDFQPSVPISGAALWYDAQVVDTERFGISVLRSADAEGACLANYVEATGIQSDGQQVTGVTLRDTLTGASFPVRSRVVIIACGPWSEELLANFGIRTRVQSIVPSLAMNAVIDRFTSKMALGLATEGRLRSLRGRGIGSDLIFLVPWKTGAIIGTIHGPYQPGGSASVPPESLLQRLLGAVNSRMPAMALELSDVRLVHKGLLPSHPGPAETGRVDLVREGYVIDHSAQGLQGVISIVGVKFTSSRYVAEQAIDLAVAARTRVVRECQTKSKKVVGGDLGSLPFYVEEQGQTSVGSLARPLLKDLVRSYGTGYAQVLAELPPPSNGRERPTLSPADVLRAKVRHAVRSEMAHNLEDVVLRRIGIGADGCPSQPDLVMCANEMASVLGWSPQEVDRQIKRVAGTFRTHALAA